MQMKWTVVSEETKLNGVPGPIERTERLQIPGGGWLYKTTTTYMAHDGPGKPLYASAISTALVFVPDATLPK